MDRKIMLMKIFLSPACDDLDLVYDKVNIGGKCI